MLRAFFDAKSARTRLSHLIGRRQLPRKLLGSSGLRDSGGDRNPGRFVRGGWPRVRMQGRRSRRSLRRRRGWGWVEQIKGCVGKRVEGTHRL